MVAVIAVAGAERGVLFKTAESLESTCDVEFFVFDDIGILTLDRNIQGLVRTHLVSAAVHEHVAAILGDSELDVCFGDVRAILGEGIEATKVFAVSVVADETRSRFERITYFTLYNYLRRDSFDVMKMLAARRLEVYALIGDMSRVMARTAEAWIIPIAQARVDVHWKKKVNGFGTSKKVDRPRNVPTEGSAAEPRRKVMLIGDGANDALVLVQADVGIPLESGTALAFNVVPSLLSSFPRFRSL
ncbi:hypothetical protein FRC07_006455 [Ceratobasidium sp. 392]|nr:hypothetical protein FRC07_006455 [Ceratobasidium sp. 392]